ncbi:GNAT family N-acetyltransferase [Tenacibaculum finnmarkense]|uniref:GNAT family N-acetyltransferase n=1 Tax=Tenacibaculum finnmarkense TaxID=2781243 RepID=UPI001EFAC30D|nr:GNAT family N-acetyltransferase [Tenacibaculum finnmarkense]MCG8236806.1 GNAT family N-acetyltransferase [Tenacibaculum finnmarkense genomovar ulcerans]MCG8831120.1 GNAT family N-acetyltransferase [Tenacibaculum finnmarkense]
MIFETERLLIRKLIFIDLKPFHCLESNPLVLQYATGEVKTILECEKELIMLINKYEKPGNDFFIYAVERKSDGCFIGTLGLIKDVENKEDDEIGYRFIQQYWGKGYASELCEGLIGYCKRVGMKKIIAYVIDKNIASSKILKRFNFKVIKHLISDDIGLPETKYELIL